MVCKYNSMLGDGRLKDGFESQNFRIELPPPLPKEEQASYFQMLREGNISVRNKLIEHNLRLVMYIIRLNLSGISQGIYSISEEDLFEIGVIGLIRAVDTYNPEKSVNFSSYATKIISNTIIGSLRKPLKRTTEVSLNNSLTNTGNSESTFMELLLITESAEDIFMRKELYRLVLDSIKNLNDREKQIIELRFPLDGDALVHTEIAKIMNLSRETIRVSEIKAIAKIKKYLEENGIIDYIKPKNLKDKSKNKQKRRLCK